MNRNLVLFIKSKGLLYSLLFGILLAPATFTLCASSEDNGMQNQPKLIEQTVVSKGMDSNSFKQLILNTNKNWLNLEPGSFSYEFSMESNWGKTKHTWKANVTVKDQNLSIQTSDGKNYTKTIDNKYDPNNSAYPPDLLTILQGTTFFGPLHELCWTQSDDEVKLVSQDLINGKETWIGQIFPTANPSQEAINRWEERLRKRATRPTYLYEFLPQKDSNGKMIIEIKCLYAEGPGWTEILASYKKNPSKIIWGGEVISAEIKDFRGEERPVIVLNKDIQYQKESPITLTQFNNGVNNMTLDLTLGEGLNIFDEDLFNQLKEKEPKPKRFLPMRVGCGIWGAWYGYSGGGADIDQIWVEKVTGLVLKEEGFRDGKCCFTVNYEDYEKAANDKYFPKHIIVTLHDEGNIYPWVFDMRFDVYGKKVWLLKELTEKQASTENATAEIKNVCVGSN